MVTADGVIAPEDELPTDAEDVSLARLTRSDLQEEEPAALPEVRHPGHDEVITVTGLVGETLELGFNTKIAKFFQIDGDLIAALPNGGLVGFEGYTTALDGDALVIELGTPPAPFVAQRVPVAEDLLFDTAYDQRATLAHGTAIIEVLNHLRREGVERLVVLPLFPQYASSSTGSGLEEVYRVAARMWNVPALSVVPSYYRHPAYLDSLTEVSRQSLGDLDAYDFFLISFHGLPERHVVKSDLGLGAHCLAKPDCCETISDTNAFCYRAQSVATARALAERLGIPRDRYGICFQSRLGRTPWIRPYTDQEILSLPEKGVKRLAVMIPSFTVDCLETLEEIAMRGRESFIEAGGEHFHMVPALNAHPSWVKGATQILGPYL